MTLKSACSVRQRQDVPRPLANSAAVTTVVLARQCAQRILHEFQVYDQRFQEITRRARGRFAERDWAGALADSNERLELYAHHIDALQDHLEAEAGTAVRYKALWTELKEIFRQECAGSSDPELKETFYNSLVRRFFHQASVDPEVMFVASEEPFVDDDIPGVRVYKEMDDVELIRAILEGYQLGLRFRHPEYDCRLAAAQLRKQIPGSWESVEMLPAPFFRDKGAYLVGRIVAGAQLLPLVLVLTNREGELAVDALITVPSEVSIIFSFTRSHFQVETSTPGGLVLFLKSVMPLKRKSELYTSLGYNKHGKTLLYRDILQHLESSDERFELARGEKGMVMTVFTLPTFDVVFKLIKDRFAYPKTTTRAQVLQSYELVFHHDKVGRMVDAHEFVFLEFEKSRFTEECLEELLSVAAQTVVVEGERVTVKHLYAERKVTPLNLFVKEESVESVIDAVRDYGSCIKDLARANIFPGDLLLKNFGVTRNGRVVFYDYDEICLVTDCHIRELPDTDDYGTQSSYVGPHDTFPEELRRYLGLQGLYREVFVAHHDALFRPSFWREVQQQIQSGHTATIRPYRDRRRLRPLSD